MNQKIRIKTPKGSEEMTIEEYRRRVRDAEKWVKEQWRKDNPKPEYPPPPEYYQKAQDKFGLNNHWQSVGNPFVYGKT